MTTAPRLFDLDTVMLDVVAMIDVLPTRGNDAEVLERLVTPGGGFNVMSAARRQGMAVTYAGQLGSGPFADIAKKALVAEGIQLPVPANDSVDLGLCFVLVEKGGERTFVTSPGAEGTLSLQDLSVIDVKPGDYVFVSGYNFVYPAICATSATWLQGITQDAVVIFDPGPRGSDIPRDVLSALLTRCNWLVCNEPEAMSLTKTNSLDAALEQLSKLNVQAGVIVRVAERGCILLQAGNEPEVIPGFSANVVDTTGAGDTHGGVFIAELAKGTGVSAALTRANAACAIAIGKLGPATAPSSEEVTDFLSKN